MRWVTQVLSVALVLAAVVSLAGCYEGGPGAAPPDLGSTPPATPREVPIPATRQTPTPDPTTPAATTPTTDTRAAATTAGSGAGAYTVRPGDVCWRIAQEHGVTTASLMAANPRINDNCSNLRIGWELVIP